MQKKKVPTTKKEQQAGLIRDYKIDIRKRITEKRNQGDKERK